VGMMKFEIRVTKHSANVQDATTSPIAETDTSSLSSLPTSGGVVTEVSEVREAGPESELGLSMPDEPDEIEIQKPAKQDKGKKEVIADVKQKNAEEVREQEKPEKRNGAKVQKDELDISNWFDDELDIGDASEDGDDDSELSSRDLPKTTNLAQDRDEEDLLPKTVESPVQKTQAVPRKVESSQSAATDVLDKLNMFVPKKK
jgi:hypothetical protein